MIDKITEFRDSLNEDHSLMKCADEVDDNDLNTVANLISTLRSACNDTIETLIRQNTYDKTDKKSSFNVDDLTIIASFAAELDSTGDPIFMKEASVLDQILLTFGRPGSFEAFKKAEETEVDRLRMKYRQEAGEAVYKKPKEQLDKEMKTADLLKNIKDKVKEYRPLEAPLSTRTCPDHPGAQMARIGEGIFQCSLDKQIYNYQGGFKNMRGDSIPGGDVSGQTQSLNDHSNDHLQFDTRESKLNP